VVDKDEDHHDLDKCLEWLRCFQEETNDVVRASSSTLIEPVRLVFHPLVFANMSSSYECLCMVGLADALTMYCRISPRCLAGG